MSDILDEKRPTRGDARRDAIVQAARRCVWKKASPKSPFPTSQAKSV